MVAALVILLVLIGYLFFSLSRSEPSRSGMARVCDTRSQVRVELNRKTGGLKHKFLVRTLHGMTITANVDDDVYLFPEPSNRHDSNAIIVANSQTDAIGYIAQEENTDLSDYLQNGGIYSARITWATDDRPKRYMLEVCASEKIEGSREY